MTFSLSSESRVTNLLFDIGDLFQVIAFDELKTDYKNPIDQCNSLNPVSFYKTLLISQEV
jgi:hypothetical protein